MRGSARRYLSGGRRSRGLVACSWRIVAERLSTRRRHEAGDPWWRAWLWQSHISQEMRKTFLMSWLIHCCPELDRPIPTRKSFCTDAHSNVMWPWRKGHHQMESYIIIQFFDFFFSNRVAKSFRNSISKLVSCQFLFFIMKLFFSEVTHSRSMNDLSILFQDLHGHHWAHINTWSQVSP